MNECITSNSVGSNAVFSFCLRNKIKLIYSATSASLGNNWDISKPNLEIISKYELILGKTKTNIDDQNIIGRVINISYNSSTKNHILDYALLTDISPLSILSINSGS